MMEVPKKNKQPIKQNQKTKIVMCDCTYPTLDPTYQGQGLEPLRR